MLTIHHFVRGPLANNMFLLADEATGRAAIVDPGIDSEDIHSFAQERGWQIHLIINTHAHFDHVYNNAWYAAQTGAPIALHSADLPILRNLQETCLSWGIPVPDASPEPSILLEHGEPLDVFGHQLEVRHTPGHSPGQVCFYAPVGTGVSLSAVGTPVRASAMEGQTGAVADSMNAVPTADALTGVPTLTPIALVGDTLFRRGVGRWDLPLASWDDLESSIREQLYTLADETLVLCGHGDFTTIGEEARLNPFVGSGARLVPKP